jgi:hypothetical protein
MSLVHQFVAEGSVFMFAASTSGGYACPTQGCHAFEHPSKH